MDRQCTGCFKNKFGQRQSQTPFSSAFWSVLHQKTIWIKIEHPIFLSHNKSWVKKALVQKYLGQKKFVSENIFGFILILGQKTFRSLTWLHLSWFQMFWIHLSWFDLSWLDLIQLNLIRLDLSWLDLSWFDLSCLDLSWLDLSWLDLS